MAHPLDPKTIVPAPDFDLGINSDANAKQANETFAVTSYGGNVLGTGGEIKGFAKYQYKANQAIANRYSELDHILNGDKTENVQALLNHESNVKSASSKIPQAQKDLDAALHLPETDQTRKTAQQTLDDLRVLLEKSNQEITALGQTPDVQAYLKIKAERADLAPTVSRQYAANVSAASLFLTKEKNKMMNAVELGGDRSLLARSVASKVVDSFLETGVVAGEKFGVDKDGRAIGISVQVDGAGITGGYGGKECFLETDYSDPQIQKGLSDLEVNDYITGQIDRHLGNVFVDPVTKKVTGIDNDLAFPECTREQAIANQLCYDRVVQGLPSPIHKQTADRIRNLDPEELRRQLKEMPAPDGVGKLSDGSIKGAVDRLKKLQDGLKSGNIKVVDQFNKQTYDDAITKQSDVIKQKHGKDLGQCGSEDSFILKEDRTSYQGAVAMAKWKVETLGVLTPDELGKRPENTVQPINRDPRYQAYLKMDANQKGQYDKTSAEIGNLDKQLSACRQKQAALNVTPHGMRAVTAFFQKDKVDKQLQALRKEEGDCLKGMQDKVQELDRMTSAIQNGPNVAQGQRGPSPTGHSVRGALHPDHADAGPSVAQSVKTAQLQKAPSDHSLRKDHPELVHTQGQKVTGPQQGQHV